MTRPVAANLVALMAFALLAFAAPAFAADGQHKLALQISDEDPQKMTAVLNVAANVSRYYSELGEEVQIKIVAFNAGLNMLREDVSPVKDRLTSFEQSMPNVEFLACDNTIQAIARKEGKEPPIVEMAEIVTAGVVTLIELDEAGWTIVRP